MLLACVQHLMKYANLTSWSIHLTLIQHSSSVNVLIFLFSILNKKSIVLILVDILCACYLQIASEGLKHRVFEVSLADLQKDEDQAYRKIRLRAEDVQGKNVLTNFWGMDFTTDKVRSLVRKWQTLIEAHVDVKTTDSFTLRMFCIGFTKKRANQQKRTCYAQSSQIRQVYIYILLYIEGRTFGMHSKLQTYFMLQK